MQRVYSNSTDHKRLVKSIGSLLQLRKLFLEWCFLHSYTWTLCLFDQVYSFYVYTIRKVISLWWNCTLCSVLGGISLNPPFINVLSWPIIRRLNRYVLLALYLLNGYDTTISCLKKKTLIELLDYDATNCIVIL